MKIRSGVFGNLLVRDSDTYSFPNPIAGIGGVHRWVLIERAELAPFKWLQACDSLVDGRSERSFVSLMMLDPVFIKPDYKVNLNEEIRDLLACGSQDQLIIQVLITVPEDPREMTANLLAPLLFNPKNRRALQTVIEGNRNQLRVKVIHDA